MDNRNLSPKELALLRKKAVESVTLHGLDRKTVCKIFGFSRNSVSKYINEYASQGEESFKYRKRGVKPRTGGKLTKEQEMDLIGTITTKTPDELGMNYTLWNSRVIHEYISVQDIFLTDLKFLVNNQQFKPL